jgi:hypothetical protein
MNRMRTEMEIQKNRETNGAGMRARKARRVSRSYGNAIGRLAGNNSDAESTSSQNETIHDLRSTNTRSRTDRIRIRRKLKQKSKIPGHVAWMKWMNSDAKNRKSTPK